MRSERVLSFKPKICILCEKAYRPTNPNQKVCPEQVCKDRHKKNYNSQEYVRELRRLNTQAYRSTPEGQAKDLAHRLSPAGRKQRKDSKRKIRAKRIAAGANDRICDICEETFTFTNGRQLRCSEKCSKIALNRDSKERYRVKGGAGHRRLFPLILKRDGCLCQACQTIPLDQTELTVDHIIPVSWHGWNQILDIRWIDDTINLQLLCQSCNSKKADKINQQARNLIQDLSETELPAKELSHAL